MISVNHILQFNFSPSTFSYRANKILSRQLINNFQAQISELNAITEHHKKPPIDPKPTKGIREVYLKFIKKSRLTENFESEFDKREIRVLSFSLTYKVENERSIFENPNYLKACLKIFNTNWRDSFISGLLDCYLSNWNSQCKESINALSGFLITKITEYEGSKSLLLNLKEKAKFFEKEKGDLDLGYTLAIKGELLSSATKYLLLPDNWITYQFFLGVITGFFEKTKSHLEDVLDDIVKTLELHSNDTKATKSNKLIISKMINHSIHSNDTLQNKVKDIAFRLVGDPGINSVWRPFEDATQTECTIIYMARKILNEWVTRQFISVFFEKCINDSRRKNFWLQYSKKISSFKVFGPRHIKRILKLDQRISEFVDVRFHSVNSNRDTSAFMFLIDNYKMIEFSDPGFAFYAYKISNINAPAFDSEYVNSISSFINGRMPPLVRNQGHIFYDYTDEGKLSHADTTFTWERKFQQWLTKKAGINV